MSTTTLAKPLAEAITTQRTAWTAAHGAKKKLEDLNREIEGKLCECQPPTDAKASLATLATKRAEKAAFRAEYEPLAAEARAKAEKALEDATEDARYIGRTNMAPALNAAVQAIRSHRVQSRMEAITIDVARWAATSSSVLPSEAAVAALTPALRALQERHRKRNMSGYVPETAVRWHGTYENRVAPVQGGPSDTDDFLHILAEADPSVGEIDALPVLGGPNDIVEEEHFEKVAQFLEKLSAEDAQILTGE